MYVQSVHPNSYFSNSSVLNNTRTYVGNSYGLLINDFRACPFKFAFIVRASTFQEANASSMSVIIMLRNVSLAVIKFILVVTIVGPKFKEHFVHPLMNAANTSG